MGAKRKPWSSLLASDVNNTICHDAHSVFATPYSLQVALTKAIIKELLIIT